MKLFKKLSIGILACFLFFITLAIAPNKVNAGSSLWGGQEGFGTSNEIGKTFDSDGTPVAPQMVIINVLKVFLGFLGIIFLIIIVLAGYKYMTAGGNEDQIKEALTGIRNGVIGLLIILMSFAITNFVTTCVIGANKYSTSTWYCSIK